MCINRTHNIISVSSCISNELFKHFSMYFLQIDMLYQGPPIIQSQLCLYISYYKCWFVLVIDNIPTWCNTVFKRNEMIIYLYLVFILSINNLVYFTQLLQLIAICSTLFWSSCPILWEQLIWNIEKIFNNDGNSVISFYILSAVYSIISNKYNQLIISFMLVVR